MGGREEGVDWGGGGGKKWHVGSTTYDKCREIAYRIKNLDGQDRIKNLDDQDKIFKRDARVQIVLDKRNKNSFTVII